MNESAIDRAACFAGDITYFSPSPTMSFRTPTASEDMAPARLRALFELALEQPADSRDDWIAANAADADERALLLRLIDAAAAADPASGLLETSAVELAARIGIGDETRPDRLLGQRVGGFRLVRLLGQGGAAAVFLAEREDRPATRQVAIKLMRRGLHSEAEERRFRRERRALAMLSHPNIARLIDGGVTEAGIPYLVMDYVDGVRITHYAFQHRLDLCERLRLFLAVCCAVDAAHRQRIVHCDLKPANILVGAQGEVKLVDFGIAELLEDGDRDARTGRIALTPGYAAPEQYHGGPISTATDVYALGVTLYELLLGVRPEPRPALRTTLCDGLDGMIRKALAERAERRFASASTFADAIERHLSSGAECGE